MRGRNQVNPTLDRYLKDSFEVIRYVHDNLPVLERIAGRLTPVEDLVEFKNQVEHLYGHLAVLTEASQIILRISDAGFNLMTAPSVPDQRALLGLGSAALRDVEFFATATEFAQLRSEFDALVIYVDEVVASLDRFATKDELEELKGILQGLIDDFANTVQLGDLINNELEVIINGETFTGIASAFTDLYTKITELENGLIVEAGKVTLLESRIVNQDGTIEGLATAHDSLTTTVSLIGDELTATSQDVTDLNVSITNLDHDIHGSGGALDLLRTTVTQQGEDISVESERLTRLSAEVTGLDGTVSANADSLSSLTSTVSKIGNDIEVVSLDTVQLQSRLDLVDDELVAEATAREDLETRVEQSESGLLIQGENITEVRAALTGPGNLLPNSNFESEPLGWFVRQQGSGWVTVAVTQNLDAETKLPEEVGALGVSVSGVPGGELGISSPRTPVEPNKSYILSGYLAAENCTVSLEWRALNADGTTIEFGVAGEVTNEGGGKSLADWPRVHARIDASHDVVLIEAQLWVRDANTASPKAWLVRPMLEEASLLQEDPSPWVPGASGLDQKYAQATEVLRASLEVVGEDITGIAERLTTLEVAVGDGVAEAIQDLTAQVSENKDGITSNTNSVTKLTSRLGAVTEWEIFIDEDAPQNSYLRLASEDENSLVFQRGVTLLHFTTSGELTVSNHFDTFTGAGIRSALISELDSLGDEDYFVLVGQPNLGSKPEDLVEAFLRVGAHRFGAVVPSRAYVLLGRGGIGPGGGIEYFSRNSEDSLRVFFTLVRDAPKEIGGFSAAADALSEMSTSVEQNKDGITAVSQSVNLLGVETPDGQGFILNEGTVRVTPEESLAQWRTSLESEFEDANARIHAEEITRATEDGALSERIITAQSTADNAAADLVTAQNTLAAADSALAERIDLTQAELGGIVIVANPSFESDTGWGSSPGSDTLPAGAEYVWSQLGGRRSGNYSMALTAGTILYNSRIVATQAGDVFYVAAWARSLAAAVPADGSEARIGMRAYDADGVFIPESQQLFTIVVSPGENFGWTYGGGEYTVPDTAVGVSVYITASTSTGAGTWLFDDVTIDRVTQTDRALASLLSTTRADVQQNTTGISAAVTRLDDMDVVIEDKASVGYVNQVEGRVETYADNAAANARVLAVQDLRAEVDGNTAAVSQVMEVTSSLSGVGLVTNPSFEEDGGWDLPEGVDLTTVAASRTGDYTLRFLPGYLNLRVVGNTARTPVQAGQTVRVLAHIRKGGGTLSAASQFSVCIRWRDASGVNLGRTIVSISGAQLSGPFGPPLVVTAEPFEGAVYANAELQAVDHEAGAAAVYVDDVAMEIVSDALAEVRARYSLAVQAGGDVAGMQLLAGGGTSAIRFLAEHVGIYSSDGAFEVANGRTITRSNGYMRVEGKPFGQNNEMVVWYGPEQSNLANCRRNNAISFETNNGLHYSIGAMFSGTITAGGYTTAVAATSYGTGEFGTNGGPIVVNASFTHSRTQFGGKQQAPNWQKNTISSGTGTTSATIELWRRVGTGSWQLVASATREGVLSIEHFPGEPDIEDIAHWNNTVGLTYTDNAGGTQDRSFEVRLINIAFQGITITGDAPVPAPTNSRSLGVRTSE